MGAWQRKTQARQQGSRTVENTHMGSPEGNKIWAPILAQVLTNWAYTRVLDLESDSSAVSIYQRVLEDLHQEFGSGELIWGAR